VPKTIFISSVQKEFTNERIGIRDFIQGNRLLSRHFVVFLFEDLPARDQRPDQLYLEKMDDCDVCISIFAAEYGWEDPDDGLSPTEREFDYATSAGKYRLLFLKNLGKDKPHPKMAALTARAKQHLKYQRFDDLADLTAGIYESLIELLEDWGVIQNRPFDAAVCPDFMLEDVDDKKIKWFVKRARQERNFALKASASPADVLTHLKLTDKGKLTNAAALLFAEEPQRFNTTAVVKCAHYHGVEVSKPVPFYQVFEGTLFDQVDDAVDFILSKLDRRVGTRRDGPSAPVSYELPKEAVAELIVNAVAHRDYTSNASVQVSVFSDRIEVWNPGCLPPGLTPDDLAKPHSSEPANPLIAHPLYLAHYIESLGTGTIDMIRHCRESGLPPPVFEQRGRQFVVTVWRDWLTKNVMNELGLNERQKKGMDHVKTEGVITTIQYQSLLECSRRTAARDLDDLLNKNILQREGAGRATCYVLVANRAKSVPNVPYMGQMGHKYAQRSIYEGAMGTFAHEKGSKFEELNMAKRKPKAKKQVATLKHGDASRKNIPTVEYESMLNEKDKTPLQVAYERRNRDLDPQLVWRGKDMQDWSDLVVQAPPLYIQEKVHPKVLVDDLRRMTEADDKAADKQINLFADFNGLPDESAKTEFYQHDANWSNRMILGDSLQVMASLAEREGLRGKVQCIYLDPSYGIKFNSNFQWSTTSRDVKDKVDHITREPEQVKAFRDTWRYGIHSYLTYLRDRLTVARDLLTESGSIFVQIGDENVHRVRALMDEVFGDNNFVCQIGYVTTSGFNSLYLASTGDVVLWYARNKDVLKFRSSYEVIEKSPTAGNYKWLRTEDALMRSLSKSERDGISTIPALSKLYQPTSFVSQGATSSPTDFAHQDKCYNPPANQHWKTHVAGLQVLSKAGRIHVAKNSIRYVRLADDFGVKARTNFWLDTATGNFTEEKLYVVQTSTKVIERCIQMATDPGDLVLDPTCGSGTTAYVAEQWGRRWITIDTSRVSLALARARIMGARYPFYLLSDSKEGQQKEGEITQTLPSEKPTHGNIRHGFVYERVPHIMLKSIANNAEIDVIWEKYQETLESLREKLNKELGTNWQEWEIPRELTTKHAKNTKAIESHKEWWKQRIARQKEIDASIAAKADYEYLYDKPYEDKKKVRVAGPFTVESLSPHRILGVDEDDELIDHVAESKVPYGAKRDFGEIILENLKTAGVQQAHKEDKIVFTSLIGWPGDYICAEGRYTEGNKESGAQKKAGIFIGPEFGTVARLDLVTAAREAADAGFDVLIACAFNFDARATDFDKLGKIPVLKARMNADLHMADNLKNTGKGNLFVIFGEPDIDILEADGEQIQVKVNGVDVFHPQTGEVRSDGAEGIACWFIDTDYNEESFFVRHAYFLGQNDPYKSLKTTLKAEINKEAWETLNSDTSHPFDKPSSGRIAVKVINHLGDEVMKVFKV